MFREISIIGFLVVFSVIVVHGCVCPAVKGRRRLSQLLTSFFMEAKPGLIGVLRILLYLLTLFCVVVLVITGFYQPLFLNEHISGYLLMLHATFAPVFAGCLAVLTVMWAHNCRFDKNYWPWLQRIVQREAKSSAAVEKYELVQKVCFWLIVVLTLPVIMSLILSMFEFFGSDGQECLLDLHRYSALALALVAIIHTYLTIRSQMER